MENKKQLFFEGKEKLHVLFFYTGMQSYIEEVLGFIYAGIEAGEYVVLIDNDRNFKKISEQLKARLTPIQLKQLHYVNSLDFYFPVGVIIHQQLQITLIKPFNLILIIISPFDHGPM